MPRDPFKPEPFPVMGNPDCLHTFKGDRCSKCRITWNQFHGGTGTPRTLDVVEYMNTGAGWRITAGASLRTKGLTFAPEVHLDPRNFSVT